MEKHRRAPRWVPILGTGLGLAFAWTALSLAFAPTTYAADDESGPLQGIVSAVTDPVDRAVDDIVAPVLDTVVQPVARVAEPVVQAVAPVVSSAPPVVAPVVEPVVRDVVEPVVQNVVVPATQPVADIIEPVASTVAPVVETVSDVAAPVTEAVAPAVAPVVASLSPLTETAGAPLAPVLGMIEGALAPVTSALAPVTDALTPVTDALSPVIIPITDAVLPGGHQPGIPLIPGNDLEPGVATGSPVNAVSAAADGILAAAATPTSGDDRSGILATLVASAHALAPASEAVGGAISAAPSVGGQVLALGIPMSGGLPTNVPGSASAGAASAAGGVTAALFAFGATAVLLPRLRGRLTNSTGPISPVYPTDVSPD